MSKVSLTLNQKNLETTTDIFCNFCEELGSEVNQIVISKCTRFGSEYKTKFEQTFLGSIREVVEEREVVKKEHLIGICFSCIKQLAKKI